MTTKPNFVFVDVPERPKANSIAVKRQRLIEGLTKQAAEVKRFEQGHWTPRNWFWADDSGKFYLEVRYAKKPLVISEGKSAILCQSLDDVAAKIEQPVPTDSKPGEDTEDGLSAEPMVNTCLRMIAKHRTLL